MHQTAIKKISISLALFFLTLCFAFPKTSHATGASYATVELVPLASSPHQEVLFKTKSHLNSMGAATWAGMKFGWLVVSSKGVWEEAVHYEMGIDDNADKLERYEKEFQKRKDLKNPPESLQALLKKYKFSEGKILTGKEGQGQYTWSPTQFCQKTPKKKCGAALEQKSLGGLKSEKDKGSAVDSSFAYQGVVVFKNRAGEEDNEEEEQPTSKAQGAVMSIPGAPAKDAFEYTKVDGIVLVK